MIQPYVKKIVFGSKINLVPESKVLSLNDISVASVQLMLDFMGYLS